MTWNYRVIEIEGRQGIHEVYYYPDGRLMGYAENPCTVNWEPEDDPLWILNRMREALDKPVLTPQDFENDRK